MLAGDMGVRADANYDDHFKLALAHIGADDFLVGDIQNLDGLIAQLGHLLSVEFGPLPRLNVSEGNRSADQEICMLEPDTRDILERFARWDTLIHTETRRIADKGVGPIQSRERARVPGRQFPEMSAVVPSGESAPASPSSHNREPPSSPAVSDRKSATCPSVTGGGAIGRNPLLLAYCVTANEPFLGRISEAIRQQDTVDRIAGDDSLGAEGPVRGRPSRKTSPRD
jgi:hypothetical protein